MLLLPSLDMAAGLAFPCRGKELSRQPGLLLAKAQGHEP